MKERDAGPAADEGAFERILDQALNSPEIMAAIDHADLAGARERLRAEALEAHASVARSAAVEYDRYLRLRGPATRLPSARRSDGPSKVLGRTRDVPVSVSTLLAPSIGVVAAGVYLLCGFDLRALDVRPHLDDGLIMVAVIVAAVTAGAALGDLVWSLAIRDRPARTDGGHGDPVVRQARDAWQLALLERGLMPFLLGRLDATVHCAPQPSLRPTPPPSLQPSLQPSVQPSTRERPSQSA